MAQLPLIDLAAEGITYKQWDYRSASNPTEENFGSETPARATRTFLVTPWHKRHIFARWILGEVAVNNSLNPFSLSRTPPQRHPLFLSLWAMRITRMQGFKQAPTKPAVGAGNRTYTLTDYPQSGGSGSPTNYTLAEYESAIVEVEYEHPRYNIAGDGEFIARGFDSELGRYTELLDPSASADYVTLPGMALKFAASTSPPDGITIPYGVGKVLPLEEFTVVWRRVPYEVYQDGGIDGTSRSALHKRIYGDVGGPGESGGTVEAYPYLGTVNRFPIFGRPAETLMFSRVQPVRRFGPIPTTWEWDIHYTFSYDPFRWNWKYYHDLGGPNSGFYFASKSGNVPPIEVDPDFGPYYDTPDDDALYNTRNFADLFYIGA